jgi:hypothetical protein
MRTVQWYGVLASTSMTPAQNEADLTRPLGGKAVGGQEGYTVILLAN